MIENSSLLNWFRLNSKTSDNISCKLYSNCIINSNISYYYSKIKLKLKVYKDNSKDLKLKHNLILLILLALFCYCCYSSVYCLLYNKIHNRTLKQKTQFITLVEALELNSQKQNIIINERHLIWQPELFMRNQNSTLLSDTFENKNQNTKDNNITLDNHGTAMKANITASEQTLNNETGLYSDLLSGHININRNKSLQKNSIVNLLNINSTNNLQYKKDSNKLNNDVYNKESIIQRKGEANNSTLLSLHSISSNINQTNSLSTGDSSVATTTATTNLDSNLSASIDDIVISSSEIPDDDNNLNFKKINKHSKVSFNNEAGAQETINATTTTMDIATSSSAQFSDFDIEGGSNLIEKLQTEIKTTTNSSLADNISDEQHLTNSRLLLRLLVFGIFCLVSISLLFVYTIKFCVCRRRKHLMNLQRNVVADLSFDPHSPIGSGQQNSDISRSQQHQQIQRTTNTRCNNNQNSLLDSILGSILKRFRFFDTSSTRHDHRQRHYQQQLYRRQLMLSPENSISSIYQRLTLAERLALHQLATTSSSALGYPDNVHELIGDNNSLADCSTATTLNCSVCLANNTRASVNDHLISTSNYFLSRPPTYSEIFGLTSSVLLQEHLPSSLEEEGATIQQESSSQNNSLPAYEQACNDELSQQPETQPIIVDNNQVNCDGEELSEHNIVVDTQEEFSSSNQNQGQQQKNLLVKLNLNKTKLLSADDLMLLSKIIDVPIVVQQQQLQPQEEEETNVVDRNVEHDNNDISNTIIKELSSNHNNTSDSERNLVDNNNNQVSSNSTQTFNNFNKSLKTSIEDNASNNSTSGICTGTSSTCSSGSAMVGGSISNGNSSSSGSSNGNSTSLTINGRKSSSKSRPVKYNNNYDDNNKSKRGGKKEFTTKTTCQPRG